MFRYCGYSAKVDSFKERGHHGLQVAGLQSGQSGASPVHPDAKIINHIPFDRKTTLAMVKPVKTIQVAEFDVDEGGWIRHTAHNIQLVEQLRTILQVGGTSTPEGEAEETKDESRDAEMVGQTGVRQELELRGGGRQRQGDQGADGDGGAAEEGRVTRGAAQRRNQMELRAQLDRIFDTRRFSLSLLEDLANCFKFKPDVVTSLPDAEWKRFTKKSERRNEDRYVTRNALLAGLLRIIDEAGRQDDLILMRPFPIDATHTREHLLSQSIRGSSPKFLIAPLHYRQHWSMVFLELDTGKGLIYDSTTYEQLPDRKSRVIELAIKHLSILVDGSVNVKLRFAPLPYHLKQKDYFNCSFFAMQHLRGWLDGRKMIGADYRFNSDAIRRDLVEWLRAIRQYMEVVVGPYTKGSPAHEPFALEFAPPPSPGVWIGNRRTSGRNHTSTNAKIKATIDALNGGVGTRRRRSTRLTSVVAAPSPMVASASPAQSRSTRGASPRSSRDSIVGSQVRMSSGSSHPPSALSSPAVGSMDVFGLDLMPPTPTCNTVRFEAPDVEGDLDEGMAAENSTDTAQPDLTTNRIEETADGNSSREQGANWRRRARRFDPIDTRVEEKILRKFVVEELEHIGWRMTSSEGRLPQQITFILGEDGTMQVQQVIEAAVVDMPQYGPPMDPNIIERMGTVHKVLAAHEIKLEEGYGSILPNNIFEEARALGIVIEERLVAGRGAEKRRMEDGDEAGPSKRLMTEQGPTHEGTWRRSSTSGLVTRNVTSRTAIRRRRIYMDDDEGSPSKRKMDENAGPSGHGSQH